MFTDCFAFLCVVSGQPFPEMLGIALLDGIFGGPQGGGRNVAGCASIEFVPHALERHVSVHQPTSLLEAWIWRLAGLLLISRSASGGEGRLDAARGGLPKRLPVVSSLELHVFDNAEVVAHRRERRDHDRLHAVLAKFIDKAITHGGGL